MSPRRLIQFYHYKMLSVLTVSYTFTKHQKAPFKNSEVRNPPILKQLGSLLEMNFRTLLLIFVIVVAILSHTGVKATRVLCEDFASANHLDIDTSTSVYAKAKYTMAGWLQRLPSGPSSGGSGH
jgi:hypothetical protein